VNGVALLSTLGKRDFSQFLSASSRSMLPSATICSRGPARASVIVLACRPCPASKGVQLIAELKAVLWAKAIAGR
jgi:hypothetical protein